MKKATRVELDGADYGNVGTPVLVVNPNAMQGYGNISNVLSADYMRSTVVVTQVILWKMGSYSVVQNVVKVIIMKFRLR